jgi:hypothetical protein
MVENTALGQLTKGRKVTKHGFYYGGAGYLIGKQIIAKLDGYQVYSPEAFSTANVDPMQMKFLSIFHETFRRSREHCPNTCMGNVTAPEEPNLTSQELEAHSEEHYKLQAKLDIRLVDLCVNLMSLEHTCYHSDHAVSRCLIHGTNAAPLHIDCGGSTIGSGNLLIGMCMGTDHCDPNVHLTCHRWAANVTDPNHPEGIHISD